MKGVDKMTSPPDITAESVSITAGRALTWPALRVMEAFWRVDSYTDKFEKARAWLALIPFRSDDEIILKNMSVPLSPQDIISWLNSAWTRLSKDPHVDVAQRKRNLVAEIMQAGLDKEEQKALVSAVDYMARLASVQKASRQASLEARPLEAPSVKSRTMEAVYRKMASLAVMDLPIWISGEKGVELDWIAKSIHRIRGLVDENYIVHEDYKKHSGLEEFLNSIISARKSHGFEFTVVFREFDRAPLDLQKELHDIIVTRLDIVEAIWIIVTSGPIDLESDIPEGVYADLYAFLGPTSLVAPPLRDRIEDLWSLMEFFSYPKKKQGLVKRLDEGTKNILSSYHWPRNTEELISVTRFLAARRPAGKITPQHLPEGFHGLTSQEGELKDILEKIQLDEGFRALRDEMGRKALAQFLMSYPDGETFTSADLQRVLGMGRETSRRLLLSLEARGIVEGIRGAKGERISRYCVAPDIFGAR